MKVSQINIAPWIALLLMALFTFQCESSVSANDDLQPVIEQQSSMDAVQQCEYLTLQFPREALSSAEQQSLQFMREEEKLARDVYIALGEKWNDRVFLNITQAEQRHMDAVGCLLTKYELSDPVGENGPGQFTNSTLQGLYDQLVGQGQESLEAALRVGATIEDLDINDLEESLTQVDNADIRQVYDNLMRGSRNHLRAFYGRLTNMGVSYEAAYISAESLDDIVNSERERGAGNCGNCQGLGLNNNSGNVGCNGNGPGNGLRAGNGQGNCNGLRTGTGTGNGTRNCNGLRANNGPGNGNGKGSCIPANCPNRG
jgi:hypothetical protein